MQIDTTADGYLQDFSKWDRSVAIELAKNQNLTLSAAHFEVINLLRDFYLKYNASPSMRTLVNAMQQQYGAEKGNSIYLHKLFPDGAAQQAIKIAGLPKSIRCI